MNVYNVIYEVKLEKLQNKIDIISNLTLVYVK